MTYGDVELCAQLMNDALIMAKRLEFDVFNSLDILNNEVKECCPE